MRFETPRILATTDVGKHEIMSTVFRKGAVGDWQTRFQQEENELFETRVLPVSRRFGYV